jgi:DNA-binding CsgD family transcriptional regulator
MPAGADKELLERDTALERLGELVAAVGRGVGGTLVIESPAGSGKTALLRRAAEIADGAGIRVLRARGSELERQFAFGLARQLFERAVVSASPDDRRELFDGAAGNAAATLASELAGVDGARSTEAVIHGLYWVAVNVAQESPTLLIVDDVQWADAPSWQWLGYLARRLDGLALGLLVAGRSETIEAEDRQGSEIARWRDESPLMLEPLSEAAVQRLVEEHTGEVPDAGFATACLELTGGNPFLVIELLRALSAQVLPAGPLSIDQLRHLSLDRVGWSVWARIGRLGESAERAAQALAVLEVGSLAEAAALAGMSAEDAAAGIDSLVAAELVAAEQPFSFVHPLVRHVIYDELLPARRVVLHRAAAKLISRGGGSPDRVAGHLLEVPPGAEEWVGSALLEAALAAGRRGAPSAVVTYLTRALREHVPGDLRARILGELGLAEEKLRRPESVGHLAQAVELNGDTARTVTLVRALGRALSLEGRVAEGIDVLERGIDRLGPGWPDLAWTLERDIQSVGRTAPETVERANVRLRRLMDAAEHDPELNRRIDRLLVQRDCWEANDWRETERRATASLQTVPSRFETDPESLAPYTSVQALGWCDLYERARGHLRVAFDAAAANASITAHVLASTYRAEVHLRAGAFAEAEADARAAVELIDEHRLHIPAALAFAWLVMALIERDRSSEAREVIGGRGFDHSIPEQNVFAMLYEARAMLHLSEHVPDRALSDALHAGRLLAPLGPGPTPLPWRATAALAAHQIGQADQARQLAMEDLELARRFGAPRALGIALRTQALVGPDDPISTLRESVEVLEASEARGELARSLVELGTAMRRRRHAASETRAVLREALNLSHRCGALVTERRARDELLAAGGRPRRAVTRGVDALTPRELRVVQLAAAGATNRQIAQTLFVTPRTIEHHLRNAYGKLEISSREQLPDALEGPSEPAMRRPPEARAAAG